MCSAWPQCWAGHAATGRVPFMTGSAVRSCSLAGVATVWCPRKACDFGEQRDFREEEGTAVWAFYKGLSAQFQAERHRERRSHSVST